MRVKPKPILVILAVVLFDAAAPFVLRRPTVYHHRYQGHRLPCLWGGVPADGNYTVTHGSDGTRDGEYNFWRDGKLVATCNIEDDLESQ
jgi:hypothetical protein